MALENDVANKARSFGVSEEFVKIYGEVYRLFPPDNGKPELSYVRRTWIFPQHLDIMIMAASELCLKYGGRKEVCCLAALLHDTGLVFRRTTSSSKGHEERSIKCAKEILTKHGYDVGVIEGVLDCIRATDPEFTPKTTDQKIVRTVDALSQLLSCHFIAKAAFSTDIDKYMIWMQGKVESCHKKICFDDERKQAEPSYRYLTQAVASYKGQRMK